jgi:hypothetical protein
MRIEGLIGCHRCGKTNKVKEGGEGGTVLTKLGISVWIYEWVLMEESPDEERRIPMPLIGEVGWTRDTPLQSDSPCC